MKWYCIVQPDSVAAFGFKHGILYEYKTNNEGDTQAFNGNSWVWIDTDQFLMLHTIQ